MGGFVDVAGQAADYCVIKYNANTGLADWTRTYNNGAKNGEDKIVAITTDSEGSVYATGYSMGTSSEDYCTVKFNASGGNEWERRYATSFQDRPADIYFHNSMELYGIVVTGKSNIASTACFTTLLMDPSTGNTTKTFHYDTNEYDEATSVSGDETGIYVTGLVKLPNSTDYAIHTLRYTSASNNYQWLRVFTSPGGHEGGTFFQPKVGMNFDGNGVLMACSTKLDGFKTVCAVTRYSSNGTTLFSKNNLPATTPAGTFINDFVRDLAVDSMGNPIVAGTCSSSATGQDALVVKFSGNDGSVLWENRINGYATSGIDSAQAVAVSPEDNVVVASRMDRGNQSSYDLMATTRINNLALTKGDLVYGGGVIPGATVNSMGTPCLLSDGAIIVKATVKSGASVLNALISTRNGNQVIALQGQPVPGITGAKYATFSDPVTGTNYTFSSVITMTGTPTGQNVGLLTDKTHTLTVPLQSGKQIPGLPAGTLLSSISNICPDAFFLFAMITVKGTGITAANNVALVEIKDDGMNFTTRYVMRKGNTVTANGKASTVSSISIFSPPVGATGHARHTSWGRSTFMVGLADARKLVMLERNGTLYFNGVSGAPSGLVSGANWKSFATPGVSLEADNTTARFIMSGTLQTGVANVTTANDTLLAVSDNGTNTFGILAREGFLAPGANGAKYAALSAPISSFPGYAFKTTLSGTGVTTANNQAIYRASNAANATLLTRTGMLAPSMLGTADSTLIFNSFTNIAWAGLEAGPMIHATVRGPGVTTANNQVFYAFDSKGAMRRVLRTGDTWGTQKVKSFTILNSVAKGMCSSRSTNSNGFITALITFTNLSQSIVRIAMP